jgi:hypothetical protein
MQDDVLKFSNFSKNIKIILIGEPSIIFPHISYSPTQV